jgi:hypothetical protein
LPQVKIAAGNVIDTVSKKELAEALAEAQATEYEKLRGLKPLRLPIVTGTPASNALTMGGDTGAGIVTPAEGCVWSITHLVIEGLTASSSTPDTMNILRSGRIIWQLNGNQFCQTFSLGQLVLLPGETLQYKNVGSLAATGLITAHGAVWNVPAELIGKFA